MILKIFTHEFYSIGALFAVFGAFILFASLLRRTSGNQQFFREEGDPGQKKFRTSGNVSVGLMKVVRVMLMRIGCCAGHGN